MILGSIILHQHQATAKVVDRILVIVNQEAITQQEIDQRMGPILEQMRSVSHADSPVEKIKELRKQVIDQLISEKLLISEAKRKEIKISSEEVRRQVAMVKEQFGGEEGFEEALRQQGMTIADLENNYRGSIMSKKLIDTEIGQKIQVSPQEMFAYYDAHKGEFDLPQRARVRTIVIKAHTDAMTPDQAEERAADIARRLKDGEDFAKLAREYSDGLYASNGGDMGYVREGEMKKSIDEAIFKLKPGEISDVVTTDLGYHLFKVEDIKPAETSSFETVRKDVERLIYRIKIKEKLDQYLRHLRENAYIEFK